MIQLPVQTWSYNEQDETKSRHCMPCFHLIRDLFGTDGIGPLGTDESLLINDVCGYLLVAIKVLAVKNQNLTSQVTTLNETIADLQCRIQILETKG